MLSIIFGGITFGGMLLCGVIAYELIDHGMPSLQAMILMGMIYISSAVGSIAFPLGWMNFVSWMTPTTPPPEKRSLFQRCKNFWKELRTIALLYTIWIPFKPFLSVHNPPANLPHKGPPILLLHGFYCNGAVWMSLLRQLIKKGYSQTYTLTMNPPLFTNLNSYAKVIEKRVAEIKAWTQSDQVILIGHGLGGIAGRAYIKNYAPQGSIPLLITIGAPHHGTALANLSFFMGWHVWQLRRNNEWLNELKKLDDEFSHPPIVSIYSQHDEMICPWTSAQLEDAQNVVLTDVGHYGLLTSSEVQDAVISALNSK